MRVDLLAGSRVGVRAAHENAQLARASGAGSRRGHASDGNDARRKLDQITVEDAGAVGVADRNLTGRASIRETR